MLAAIGAKKNNKVTILERNSKLGRKILATGNGRCNFTNIYTSSENYNNPSFVENVFEQFDVDKTIKLFSNLGIYPKVEDEGKAYPLSEQAQTITTLLELELIKLDIEIIYEETVTDISYSNKLFFITTNKSFYEATKVILSTGGMALPQSGSDGIGYEIAKKFGHNIKNVYPSLTKIDLESKYLNTLSGVKFPGKVSLVFNNKIVQEEESDVLFTKYGISGPGILQLSRTLNRNIHNIDNAQIKVQLLTYINKFEFIERLKQTKDLTIKQVLNGMLNNKIVNILSLELNLDLEKLVKELSKSEEQNLINILFDWRFKIIGTRDFNESQGTIGGIDLNEVNSYTLESKKIKGLYFSGEVLDIDAFCGGYNLQWAWSSGYVAGHNASIK